MKTPRISSDFTHGATPQPGLFRNLLHGAIALFVLALIPASATAKTLKVDLTEALKSNTVKLEATNFAGMYQGRTTKLTIINTSKSVVELKVDIGVVLKSDRAGLQPMVLAGAETITLMPKTTGQVDVQTFCGNAGGSCPGKDEHYTYSYTMNDSFKMVLQFIRDHSLYDHMGQNAVWVLTNQHNVGSVYDPNRKDLSKELQSVICKYARRPKAVYYEVTAPPQQIPNEPAYVPKTLKILAEFEIILESPKTMTLGVYDEKDVMIQPVFEDQTFPVNGHRFGVEFEAENVVPGKYYIRLKEGSTVLQEKMVEVN
jgi:hypothetical protein